MWSLVMGGNCASESTPLPHICSRLSIAGIAIRHLYVLLKERHAKFVVHSSLDVAMVVTYDCSMTLPLLGSKQFCGAVINRLLSSAVIHRL